MNGIKKSICAGIFVYVLSVVSWTSSVAAFYQPDYQNRVNTNFLDAMLKPGCIIQSYFYHFDSSDLRVGSREAPGAFDMSVNVSLNQFVYISKEKWGWAHPGFEVILPFVDCDLKNPAGIKDTDSGLSDIFAAFMWQSDPVTIAIRGTQLPLFWRFVAGVYFPTGDYKHDKLFNVGYNHYTFHTYFSNTILITPKWSLSSRWMYFIHTENDSFGPNRDDLEPGQLFNVHFSTAYEVMTGIRLGLLGHYWRQITEDELNGRDFKGDPALGIPGGKERLLAWGPGIFLNKIVSKKNFFMEAHALFDSDAKNRPRGTTLQVRAGIMF